jgi:hypothetical protein
MGIQQNDSVAADLGVIQLLKRIVLSGWTLVRKWTSALRPMRA